VPTRCVFTSRGNRKRPSPPPGRKKIRFRFGGQGRASSGKTVPLRVAVGVDCRLDGHCRLCLLAGKHAETHHAVQRPDNDVIAGDNPAERQPVEQAQPATTAAPTEKQPALETKPEPVPPEQYQLAFDRDETLQIAFNEHNDLSNEAYATLENLALVMRNDPSVDIVLKGYSRGFGSADYHKKMSEFSANIVKGYLVGKGVPASRIQAMGLRWIDQGGGAVASGENEKQAWVEILLNGDR
jgi:outer membrane protein OmpA-like peptidoglycan-associated protein